MEFELKREWNNAITGLENTLKNNTTSGILSMKRNEIHSFAFLQ